MTTQGNDLIVDGKVRAQQATQAGECVVLGSDGMIPESMVPSSGGGGSGSTFQSFSDISGLRAWMQSAPEGATLFLWGYTYYVGEETEFMYFGRADKNRRFHGIGHTVRTMSSVSIVVNEVYASSSSITVGMMSGNGTETSGALAEITSACVWG